MPSWKAIASSSKVPHDGRVGDVDEEGATAAAVAGRREVERLRAGHRRLHGARRLREHLEPLRHRGPGTRHRDLGGLDQLLAVLEVQLGVGAHRLEDLAEVVGADHLGAEAAVLVGQLGDLGEPDVVDLLGASSWSSCRAAASRRTPPRRRAASSARTARRCGPGAAPRRGGRRGRPPCRGARRTRSTARRLAFQPSTSMPVGRRRRGQQRVVGHRRGEDARPAGRWCPARRTLRGTSRWPRPRAAARPARGSSDPARGTCRPARPRRPRRAARACPSGSAWRPARRRSGPRRAP